MFTAIDGWRKRVMVILGSCLSDISLSSVRVQSLGVMDSYVTSVNQNKVPWHTRFSRSDGHQAYGPTDQMVFRDHFGVKGCYQLWSIG